MAPTIKKQISNVRRYHYASTAVDSLSHQIGLFVYYLDPHSIPGALVPVLHESRIALVLLLKLCEATSEDVYLVRFILSFLFKLIARFGVNSSSFGTSLLRQGTVEDDHRYILRLLNKIVHLVFESLRRQVQAVLDVTATIILVPDVYNEVVLMRLLVALDDL